MLINNIPYMEPEDLCELLVLFGADHASVTGHNAQANRCPFHDNNSPTLGISLTFPYPVNCLNPACTARSPDVLGLVARFLKTDLESAVSWLYMKFPHLERVKKKAGGIFELDREEDEEEEPIELPKSTMAAYDLSAKNNLGYRAAEYYNNWSKEDADYMGLGYDRINHRLIFPIYNSKGNIIGLVGRNMKESAIARWYNYDSDTFKKARCLLGDHLPVDEKSSINVCEGPSDYYQMYLLGIPNPRATLGGKFSEWQLDKLQSYGLPVNIVFDADGPGQAAARKLSTLLRERGVRCKIIKLPEDIHDPRELTEENLDQFLPLITGGRLFGFT